MFEKISLIHGFIFSTVSLACLYALHLLPFNQIFIDPFAEAIKNHDVMDVALSRFRDHTDPLCFDNRVVVINSGKTDRALIARTINFLHKKGARAIGVDLLFDTLYPGANDSLLMQASEHSRELVFGFTFDEEALTRGWHSDSNIVQINREGFVNLGSNDGFSVRTFKPFQIIDGEEITSFSVQLADMLDPHVKEVIKARNHDTEWINFRRLQPGSQNMRYPFNSKHHSHYAYANMREFLQDSASYDDSFFLNKIFLIGFCGEHEKALSMKDRYFTPLNEKYFGRSLPDMHGVVIHANIISMLLDRDFIDEIASGYLYLISFLVFYFNYLIFSRIVRKRFLFNLPLVRVVQLIEFVLFYSICVTLLSSYNIKVGFLLIITAVILSYEFFEFYNHKMRNRIANKINATFNLRD